MKIKRYLLLIRVLVAMCLLLVSGVVYAQDLIVSFPDSTQFDPTVWEGTLERFVFTPQGIRLHDENPQRNHNQARLSRMIINASTLSWTGEIEFDMCPSSRNRVDILLYPINSTRDTKGGVHVRYMALSVGKRKRAELHCVRISQASSSSPLVFEARETIIANTLAADFSDKTTNKLDFIVSFDATTSQWFLFAHNYSPYLPSRFHAVGHEVYEDDYQYQKAAYIKNHICITYSKSNASAFLIKSLGFYTRLVEPEERIPQEGSIIDDITYDGNAIRLHCFETPNIDKASFHLSPQPGDLIGIIEGSVITLPLATPLPAGSYQLQVSGIVFEDGTFSPPEQFNFDIVNEKPDHEDKNYPHLSEIMPFPEVDGSEYIELYNASVSVVDLRNYGLMLRKEGRAGKIIPLEVTNYLLKPQDYMVVCPWKEILTDQFPSLSPRQIAELTTFPSLPNTEAQLTLLRLEDNTTLETFAYDYKSYAPEGKKRGYSLERIDYTLKANESTNWQAASKEAGYATPGKPNSAKTPKQNNDEKAPSSLQEMAKMILAADSVEGSKVRIAFFSLKGEKVAEWHHEEVLQWAENFERGGEPPHPTSTERQPFLLLLQIRKGWGDKPKSHCKLLIY